MNAFATSEDTALAGTQGTIAFGWDLFRKEFYEYDNSGSTIVAIAAHEFAHILQFKRGYFEKLNTGTPRKSEINADYLAGYYLGQRKRANPSLKFGKTGEMFVRFGRHAENKRNRTHGNSKERLEAAEAGFRLAYIERRFLDDAVKASLEYVQA